MNGPLSAMLLWFHFIGWTVTSPTVFVDKGGEEMPIVHGSPGLLVRIFVRDLRDTLATAAVERAVARDAFCGSIGAIRSDGLWLEPIQKLQTSSRVLPEHKQLMTRVHAGAVVTDVTLHEWGYAISPHCKFCEARGETFEDTVFHRIWQCPHGAAASAAAVKDSVVSEALRSEGDPLFSRAWVACPQVRPPAEPGTGLKFFKPGTAL